MKKILTILGCVILLAATSCTKQYITPGQTNQTFSFNVAPSVWTLTTDNGGVKSYSAPLAVPVSNGFIQSGGGVIVSISYDGGNTFESLPETYGGVAYSYTYNAGNVSIYAQSADGSTPIQPTLPIQANVVLVSSSH